MSEVQGSAVGYDDQLTAAAIMRLGTAFWGSQTLLSAVELGVFSELASTGALDGEVLRERLGLHPRSAMDFFDALVALGMLEREDGRYSNTPETEWFLDQAKPSYKGDLLEMLGYNYWGSLTEALRTGLPQNETTKKAKSSKKFGAAFYADPVKLAKIASVMTRGNAEAVRTVAAKFPWKDYRSVIDVGCAAGNLLVQVALAHEHMSGDGFDLPPFGSIFDAYVAGFGLSERLSFIAGDFFTDALPPADVLVMGHVLHGFALTDKRMLLCKAYDALPQGGAIVVYDTIIDDKRRSNAYALLRSLNLLIHTPEGSEYTGAECRAWMQETGFREIYVEHLVGPESMIVGFK